MIENVKQVITDDPVKETWKHLHYFLDTQFTIETISKSNGIEKEKHIDNLKKQAKQISYCIRQSEEYFYASSKVKLSTRPVLLYYGAVSLSYALILMKGMGDCSFDKLRTKKKQKNHGLELKGDFAAAFKKNSSADELLNSIQVKVHNREGDVWGHFPNFYQFLVPCACSFKITITEMDRNFIFDRKYPQSCGVYRDIKTLSGIPLPIASILKSLPDMFSPLTSSSINTDLCRGQINFSAKRFYKTIDSKKTIERVEETYFFAIDNIKIDQKKELIDFLKLKNPKIKVFSDAGHLLTLCFDRTVFKEDESEITYIPDIIEDVHGNKFYLVKPENYFPEPASQFMVLFALSMLSRYYPDIWMKGIDENIKLAEIIDSFLNIVYRKLPNLMLDQLCSTKHNFITNF